MKASTRPALRRAAERTGNDVPDEMKQELIAILEEEYKRSFIKMDKELKVVTAGFMPSNLPKKSFRN